MSESWIRTSEFLHSFNRLAERRVLDHIPQFPTVGDPAKNALKISAIVHEFRVTDRDYGKHCLSYMFRKGVIVAKALEHFDENARGSVLRVQGERPYRSSSGSVPVFACRRHETFMLRIAQQPDSRVLRLPSQILCGRVDPKTAPVEQRIQAVYIGIDRAARNHGIDWRLRYPGLSAFDQAL